MIIKIEQTSKAAFKAEFKIFAEGKIIGSAVFSGHMTSMEGEWFIDFMGRQFGMKRTRKASGKSFRPYEVSANGNPCGYVYQTDYKTGFFKPKIYHHRLDINGQITDIFPIGCGTVTNSPVFCLEKQIALVEKQLTVYDDLHVFDVYALTENAAISTILLCFYMYTIGYYKAGEVSIKTVHKGYSLSKEKELLEKYDPEFKTKYFNL